MDSERLLSIISVIFGFGYLIYMYSGGPKRETFKYYNLFIKNLFIKHFLFAIFFGIIGIVRFNAPTLESFYFVPIFFVSSLKIIDSFFHPIYNRHIIIAPRIGTLKERILGFLILIITICGCIIIKANQFDQINQHNKEKKKSMTVISENY